MMLQSYTQWQCMPEARWSACELSMRRRYFFVRLKACMQASSLHLLQCQCIAGVKAFCLQLLIQEIMASDASQSSAWLQVLSRELTILYPVTETFCKTVEQRGALAIERPISGNCCLQGKAEETTRLEEKRKEHEVQNAQNQLVRAPQECACIMKAYPQSHSSRGIGVACLRASQCKVWGLLLAEPL